MNIVTGLHYVRTNMLFPIIDGHFWIERNGKIIDNDFKEYDYIKHQQNCGGEMKYKEADSQTQLIIIKIFKRSLSSMGLDYDSFKKIMAGQSQKIYQCYQNCLLILQDGDVLKFGSMGWKKNNSSKIWWEFGREDWVGAKSFLKKRN